MTADAGVSTEVEIPVSRRSLRHWSGPGGWTLQPGRYELIVGASSRDVALSTSVRLP